jgi:chromosome segregation ATPase
LEKKVSGLEKHLAQALKACASLDRLKDELASAQQHARERMAEVEARGREASSWQVKASESEAALAGVREENTELRARVAASQRAYTDLETRLQGTGKLQAELERHQREASAARLRADAAAADLTAAREESARHRAEADKLRSDIAAGEKRIHQLETQAAIAEDLARRCKEAADLLEKARSCLQAR